MYNVIMNLTKKRVYSILDNEYSNKIKPVFNDFHKLEMSGSYEYPEHQHDNYEVIIVIKGPYYCNLNNNELTVKNNQFLVIKPGDFHQDHLYNNQLHYVLHFSIEHDLNFNAEPIDLFIENITAAKQIFTIKNDWNPLSFFKIMKNNNDLMDKYSFKIQEPLMEVFFWNMVRCISGRYLSDEFKEITSKQLFRSNLLNLFTKNYTRDLSIVEMSKEMNMSKRKLSIYCMKYFYDSPAKLFLKYKLKKSEELLKKGTLNIKEISDYLGFDNQFHFSRAFKRVYNISPSKY